MRHTIRIYPSSEQAANIQKTCEAVVFTQEEVLKHLIKTKKEKQRILNKGDMLRFISQLRNKHQWIKDVDGHALIFAANEIVDTFHAFQCSFKIDTHPTKYRTTPTAGGFYLDDHCIRIPKIGNVACTVPIVSRKIKLIEIEYIEHKDAFYLYLEV